MSIPTIEGRRYSLGKYEIIAQPIPYSAHMLRYTVYLDGRRLGALASQPTESDCLFLENPPYVPPLVPFQAYYRPGRPKKDAPPRISEPQTPPAEELPKDLTLPPLSEER